MALEVVFVAMRKHLQSVGVVRQCDGSNNSQIGPAGEGLDWSAATLRMQGSVVVASMYFQRTIGLTGENVTKM